MPHNENDTLYEIASTDAWKEVIRRIEAWRHKYVDELIRVAAKKDVTLQEVTKVVGRIEGTSAVLTALGGKHGKNG